MCGRLNIHDSSAIQAVLAGLGLPAYPDRPPRYNVTPGSTIDVVASMKEVMPMEWMIEFGKFRHPNTKVETIKRKPHLQKLLANNRCLVPANRFYEWPDPKARPKYEGIKTRFCIHTPKDVMLLGGIWRVNPDGVAQFNVLTTDPNEQINDFHHRMPVIVPPAHAIDWMTADKLDDVYALSGPYEGPLNLYECDAYVDNGRHEGPQCMVPQKNR